MWEISRLTKEIASLCARKCKFLALGTKKSTHFLVKSHLKSFRHFVIENPSLQNKGKVIIEISNQPNTKYIRSLMKNNLDIIGKSLFFCSKYFKLKILF